MGRLLLLLLAVLAVGRAQSQEVTTFTHDSDCMADGLCVCPEGHVCDVVISKIPGQVGTKFECTNTTCGCEGYIAVHAPHIGLQQCIEANSFPPPSENYLVTGAAKGTVLKGQTRSVKCDAESARVCEGLQVESSYAPGASIECIAPTNAEAYVCQNAVFTGSLQSVTCQSGNQEERNSAGATGMCKNMTVHSTGDVAANVTCGMGPTWSAGNLKPVCEHAQIHGLIGHVGCFGQASCSMGFSVTGAESLTCGSPACTDEHSDGTEAKCIAETTQCIHSEGPVCKEVVKVYNEQGSPKTNKDNVKTCHMTGRIEVRGKFTCNHGACVQVGLFGCPMSMNDSPLYGIGKLSSNIAEQTERLTPWGVELPYGDFPSCMETVKAKELRCVDAQVTTTDGKPVGHVEGQEHGIGAPCYWMAPVEAEKVQCIGNLHARVIDNQPTKKANSADQEGMAAGPCFGILKITATRMDCRGVGSCWRTGGLGLSLKALNCDGSNVCYRMGSLPPVKLSNTENMLLKTRDAPLPGLVAAFKALEKTDPNKEKDSHGLTAVQTSGNGGVTSPGVVGGRLWISVDSLTCTDNRLSLEAKGTYPSQHQNTESQLLYQGGSLGAIPSCDYMAAKTSSVVIKEDLGDRARTSQAEHIAIMLKPRGVQLNVECASSTYVRNFRKQTTELSSSCTYPLSKALNLTSFEADGLVALTLGGLFRDSKDASPQTLNHFLKSQGDLDETCKAILDPDATPCSGGRCEPFELNTLDATIESVTEFGASLGYSDECIGKLLGSDACPVQPQLTYCLKTKTCATSVAQCEGMSKCRAGELELSAFDAANPPLLTRTSAWTSELGYELFGFVHVGSPNMRIFSGVSSPHNLPMQLQDTLFKVPPELVPTCCQRFMIPALYALSDQRGSMDNDIGGTAIVEVCGGGASGTLVALSNGDSNDFRLGLTGAVLSQRDRQEDNASADSITPNDAWEVLGEGHEVDTFVSKHTVADSTVCVYNGALKLKAQPAGDADVTTPVFTVPAECMPTNADQYKVLANVYDGDFSSLPASDRDVQHYLYFEGSTLTLFSRTPPPAALVLSLDGLTFFGTGASASLVSELQDRASLGEAPGAPPPSNKLELENQELKAKVLQLHREKVSSTAVEMLQTKAGNAVLDDSELRQCISGCMDESSESPTTDDSGMQEMENPWVAPPPPPPVPANTSSQDQPIAHCKSCAEMEWWGSFAKRLCSFKPGMVRFTYDSHSKSLVGTMVNDRDAGGVSMCRPLGNVLVLGATLAGDGHLGHALVVQVEPHGVLRTWPTSSVDPESTMDVSLAGGFFSPRQAVQVPDLARVNPTCVAKCFPPDLHTQQLHGESETEVPFSCIKMCTPDPEEKPLSSDQCECKCTMMKRLECSPSPQGTSCLQYKELLDINAELGCNCEKACARQLSGF